VDAAGPPGVDALGAAHAGFADERVPAAVVVAGVVVSAVVIFLFGKLLLEGSFDLDRGARELADAPLPSTSHNTRKQTHQTAQTDREHACPHAGASNTRDAHPASPSHSTPWQHAGHSASG
jgi:hypothetical protein